MLLLQSLSNTVRLVQLVEHQIVVLGVVGSSPTSHPRKMRAAKSRFHFFIGGSSQKESKMNKVRITTLRRTEYPDLMARYENPIEHTCDVMEGQSWVSADGKCPEGLCPSAWSSMREFVEALSRGEGNFFDGWMRNPLSAMISCNDGFRPVSFYLEVIA